MRKIFLFSIVVLFVEILQCQDILSNKNISIIKFAGTENINATFFYSDQFNDSGTPFFFQISSRKKRSK